MPPYHWKASACSPIFLPFHLGSSRSFQSFGASVGLTILVFHAIVAMAP